MCLESRGSAPGFSYILEVTKVRSTLLHLLAGPVSDSVYNTLASMKQADLTPKRTKDSWSEMTNMTDDVVKLILLMGPNLT